MTQTEFLAKLSDELKKSKISDVEDIVSEYEQHFALKLADGFSEEEICARLGEPALLAAQFDAETGTQAGGSRFLTGLGLGFADFFAGIFFLLLGVWTAVMAAFSIACAVLAVCLLGGLNLYSLIPPMPYWCGAVFGLMLAALSVLSAAGTVYFAAFLRQLIRSFGRFQHNTMAPVSGRAVLPPLPIAPQMAAGVKRRLRSVSLVSLALFAACFVLGMLTSMLSAGALPFWHVWGWFGYTA